MKTLAFIIFVFDFFRVIPADILKQPERVSITGNVLELSTNEPMIGAHVYLHRLKKEIYTDFEGKFSFENISPGVYDIEISYVSYRKVIVNDLVVSNSSDPLIITLQ